MLSSKVTFGWAAALILAALLSSSCLAARVRSIDAELLAASDKLSDHNDQELSGNHRFLLEIPTAADPWGAPAPGYGAPAPYNGYNGYYGGYGGYGYNGYYGYGYSAPSPSYSPVAVRRMAVEASYGAPSYGPAPSPNGYSGYGYNGYGYNGYGYNGYYGYGYAPMSAPSGASRRMAMTTSSRRVAAASNNVRAGRVHGWGITSHLRRFMLDTPEAVSAPMGAPAPSYGAPAYGYNGYGYNGYGYNGYYGYGYSGYGAPAPYGSWN